MIYLAVLPNDKASIEEVATAYGISENHLVKVVHKLGKLGYVETLRGRGGGLRLARDPADVTIGEIVRKMEPGFTMVECFDPEINTCPINGICGLKPLLAEAISAFLTTLDGMSLARAAASQKRLRTALKLPVS